jgi:hypothetical protein
LKHEIEVGRNVPCESLAPLVSGEKSGKFFIMRKRRYKRAVEAKRDVMDKKGHVKDPVVM